MRTDGKKQHFRWTALAGAVAACLLVAGWQRPAAAYGSREHQRMADQAFQILNLLRRGSQLPDVVARKSGGSAPPRLTARPASVPADQSASWQAFVAEAMAAPGRLDQMLTGLADSKHLSSDCGDLLPVIAAGEQLKDCRAEDLSFAMSGGWGSDDNRCYLRRGYTFGDPDQPEIFQTVPNSFTGALLGYWAQHPDNLWDDTHMDIRPTNAFFVGAIKSFAEDALEYGTAVVVAPFVCIGDLLLGDGDCLDDARNIAHQADPIGDFELPPIPGTDLDGHGGGSFTTTGMWHFVSPGRSGDFNRLPGLQISTGGLPGTIDKWDAAAIALGDLSGYTINPDNSLGVAHYSPFADGPLTRRRGDWTGVSFPHVEFESLDNLAQYGWKNFCAGGANGRNAQFLAFPLHAIGDAVQPHHVTSTLGWGHRPWESFAGVVWPDIFEKAGSKERYAEIQTILGYAWRWWNLLKSSNDDVKRMIETLASDTLASPGAVEGGIFQPLDQNYDAGELRGIYSGQTDNLKDLLMRGMGASVALLARASTRVDDAVSVQTGCSCGANQARRGLDLAGRMLHSPTCVACGQGLFADAPYWLDSGCVAYCPEDKPFVVNGACSATCSGAGCSSCPPDKPFTENGVCVASCSAANHFVVANSQCSSGCPVGQQANEIGYCATVVPPGPSCQMSMPGHSQPQGRGDTSCCVGRGDACTKDNDCCSMMCGPDGFCLGQAGDHCVVAADCITNNCMNMKCAPNGAGHNRCATNADCLSNVCHGDSDHVSAGSCLAPIGTACANASECVAGICYGRFATVCCLAGGASCSKSADCCSGTCSQGKCTVPPIFVD